MNDEVQNTMHPEFARWYSAVELDANQERRQARWEGICALLERDDFGLVEALIRLAFKTRQLPATPSLQLIHESFKEADETFDTQGNDREMQVLAGACLAAMMVQDGDNAHARL